MPRTLDRLLEYLGERRYRWDIVVVSNGSTDGTQDVAQTYAARDARIMVIGLQERGKGLATRTGVLESDGTAVFLCDADLSMPADCIEGFLRALQTHDVVVGSREADGATRYNEPWHRHLMGRVFNFLVQKWAVPGIEDTQCGFKAFRRPAADLLFERQTVNGWGFDVEILFLARKYGLSVSELGIPWYFDTDTRVRPGVDTLSMLWELLQVRARDVRGVYATAPAAAKQSG